MNLHNQDGGDLMSQVGTTSESYANIWETMSAEELLSTMTLADRAKDYDKFTVYRTELLYRLRCAEPLISWSKPQRLQ